MKAKSNWTANGKPSPWQIRPPPVWRRSRHKRHTSDILQTIQRRLQEDETGQSSLHSSISPIQRQQLFDAVYTLLKRLAQQSPRLIFFEDAPWLNSASLELLRFLEPRIACLPMLILLARRSEAIPPATSPGANNCSTRSAAPVQPARQKCPVKRWRWLLLARRRPGPGFHLLADGLAEVIHQQSLGNPFIVNEITDWFNHPPDRRQRAERNSPKPRFPAKTGAQSPGGAYRRTAEGAGAAAVMEENSASAKSRPCCQEKSTR